MPDVTVLTIAYRPGYIDTMVQALQAQSLDRERWEWVLVDDLWAQRKEAVARHINGAFNFQHMPPREIKPYSATGIAINTGLAAARGKLVYFMADYMYPHPECLWRHWYIYTFCGPPEYKVLISGPIIDGITCQGLSVWGLTPETLSKAWPVAVRVGDEVISYNEHMPALPVDIKDRAEVYTEDKAISIWAKPFIPQWPATPGLDWRMGGFLLESRARAPDLFEFHGPACSWFAGRNDSADLELLKASGGLEEEPPGKHGGLETNWEQRMRDMGACYLVDQQAPAMILPHPTRKREFV